MTKIAVSEINIGIMDTKEYISIREIKKHQLVPRRLFCFGSLVILDMVCRYLSLFLLYINIKIDKNRR